MIFCYSFGVFLIKNIGKNKKMKNGLEILANYTYIQNFKKVDPFVWSLAMCTDRLTHTYTDIHFGLRELKMDNSVKISISIIYDHSTFSIQIVYMGEYKMEVVSGFFSDIKELASPTGAKCFPQ